MDEIEMTDVISHQEQVERFQKDGFLLLEDFYDIETEIEPIQEGVRVIIELMARKHGVDGPYSTPEEAMSECYPKLIAINRAWGGEIYDAVKQIPEFVALVANSRNVKLFEALRPGAKPGVAAGGYGIRIDNPSEDKFRAWWHQEFPAQLRSNDGLVFWSPLLAVTSKMGPVQIAVGSHIEGFVPTYDDDAGLGRAGAYALRLQGEEDLLARYNITAPLTKPGDLLIMDFFVLHQSGYNVSKTPRWSMQLRYFNFRDPLAACRTYRIVAYRLRLRRLILVCLCVLDDEQLSYCGS
jgi:ectoine hydroxylase-related dioxygenase (phytanoyl-CoA dioxygenase family)